MPKSPKYLLIGSTEAYSGKSTTIMGLYHQLQIIGLDVAYGKPLGSCLSQSGETTTEEDVQFITENLNLSVNRLAPTMLALNEVSVKKRLVGEDNTDYQKSLVQQYSQIPFGDLVLLEGPGNLEEGSLFNLSLLEVATALDAAILLVTRYKSLLSLEGLLSAKQRCGSRIVGALINDVPEEQFSTVNTDMRQFLEQQEIPLLGILPKNALLRSVSVRELVNQLRADVLCCSDRLDLMVESLAIGAMNVNAAVKYFHKRRNMAVVTGGDRVEIQQAALDNSTSCLILTGYLPPPKFIKTRAEELEIPILSVDLDTLNTVEIINRAFGQVRLHEPIKVQCIRQLMAERFDINRLLTQLGFQRAVALS